MTQVAQAKNVRTATDAIAKIATIASAQDQPWNIVLTHGNGPQVGFLALQQAESFSLDVLNAQTQGMIGAQVCSSFTSFLFIILLFFFFFFLFLFLFLILFIILFIILFLMILIFI